MGIYPLKLEKSAVAFTTYHAERGNMFGTTICNLRTTYVKAGYAAVSHFLDDLEGIQFVWDPGQERT